MFEIKHYSGRFCYPEKWIDNLNRVIINLMINYARQRAIEILKTVETAVLATNGPSGVQVSQFPCEAVGLELYLLLPRTSDHLFNLEHDERLALHTDHWELSGKGRALSPGEKWPGIALTTKNATALFVLLKVIPIRINVLRSEGWGPAETIDLTTFR